MRRLIFVLLLAAAPLLADDPVSIRIDSKVLGETRTILVRVPTSYATNNRSYPVLYMTDGDRQLPHTIATVDFLAREGRIPELILVGITNTDRTRDLTPTRMESVVQDGRTITFPTSGGANKFLSFITTEVMPQIEKKYRTLPYRAFAGHSFGGLFALYALFERPDLFQGIIAASPALIWDNRYVIRRATEMVNSGRAVNTTLVFTVGDEGERLDTEFRALESVLKQKPPKDFVFEAIKLRDEDHGSVVMPTHYAGLRKIFAEWRLPIDGDIRTQYARAKDHYARLSKRFGFTMPVPEATTNLIAYRLLQAGHVDDALEVFKANVAAYPESANVYDSVGEAYEQKGDLSRARENYARAAEIGKKTADANTPIFEANLKRVTK